MWWFWVNASVTLSTVMKFRLKFFWKWSFFDQNQRPLKSVEPFERNLRALFISQCPYKFSSFLDLRNSLNRFRLFSRDFRLYGFFFAGSACFSLASPRNLPSWVQYYRKFERFGKEFRWTKFSGDGKRHRGVVSFCFWVLEYIPANTLTVSVCVCVCVCVYVRERVCVLSHTVAEYTSIQGTLEFIYGGLC